jgi:cell wall-associated NlpC family hydrolase
MTWSQAVTVDGKTVRVKPMFLPEEVHHFPSEEEAQGRADVIVEGVSWVKTPFVDCGDIKGSKGAVDCAMLAVRTFVDTGVIEPFDPRPYAPDHMRHSRKEEFLSWLSPRSREVEKPQIGDVAVYLYGWVFSHCGIVINSAEIVHAYKRARMVMVSRMDEDFLNFAATHHDRWRRHVKYFDVWSR